MHDGVFMLEPPLEIPTTLLYGIQPSGYGTWQVESLYSHLLNLAKAHSLTPNKLVGAAMPTDPEANAALSPKKSDARVMRRTLKQGWGWGWGWDKEAGRYMIGTGPSSMQWAKALTAATGIGGLESTTFVALSRLVTGASLVSKVERVCLACVQADHRAGTTPYGRLLWRMNCVTCCPEHRQCLVEVRCGRPVADALGPYARVKHAGVCGHCGAVAFRCMGNAAAAEPREVWRAQQCAQLIADMQGLGDIDPAPMKRAVQAYAEQRGGLVSLATRCGAAKSVFSRWLGKPRARISMHQLLDLAAVEGISLSALVRGAAVPADSVCPDAAPTRRPRVVRRVDHAEVRAAMEQALQSGKTATKLAEEMGVDVGTLAKHADLYAPLRALTKSGDAARVGARHRAAVSRAEFVARTLLSEGRELSLRNAGCVTGTPWYPSQLEATALTLIRVGLGNDLLRYPAIISRFGESLLTQVRAAIMNLQSAVP